MDNSGSTTGGTVTSILGELLWHSVTADPTIVTTSEQHYASITSIVEAFLPQFGRAGRRSTFLEVAAYAHITGYRVAKDCNTDVTLADISVETLALGAQVAGQNGYDSSRLTRVACDFHDLPFEDAQFDVVYIASALHHTWNWKAVVREMVRVLAPGGLLIFENEPVARALAMYKFRTNRAENMRPFEKALEQNGMMRTVADPFPGSRPELLFGMIENQTIPLPEFKAELSKECDIKKFNTQSVELMGDLEKEALRRRRDPQAKITQFLTDEMTRRLDAVRPSFTPTDAALGCSIPSREEVEQLSQVVAKRIASMPEKEDSTEYKEKVAELFGAAVHCVVRKRGSVSETTPKPLRFQSTRRSDVSIAYPPEISRVLEDALDVLPDVQTAPRSRLSEAFHDDEWHFDRHGDLNVLYPKGPKAAIHCSAVTPGASISILVRVYVVHAGRDWRLRISYCGESKAELGVYQTDSAIISCTIQARETGPAIVVETLHADNDKPIFGVTFTIAALRACALPGK